MSTTSSAPPPIDPGLHPIARLVVGPAMNFARVAAQGGLLLIGALVAALIWRNSGAGASYDALWKTPLGIEIGGWKLELPLLLWINDGLMAIFFLVVGAEIKREVVVGELRGVRRAMVPALAAIGGMAVPAGLYLLLARDHPEGFGTPMATDIAFSLAAIRLLGKRVPDFVVKVLMGLAIIDDLGAIVVIAVFYGGDMHFDWLLISACLTALLVSLNLLGVWRTTPYLVIGIPLWYAVHHAGIHPTIAGVVIGLCIPARGVSGVDAIVAEARQLLTLAERESETSDDGDAAIVLSSLERRLEQHKAPLERVVEGFNPMISFLVLPLFALANGGISLEGMGLNTLLAPASIGIIAGLFIGKQIGIFGILFACVKTKLLPLPAGVRFTHLWGMSIIAGIGFTMSLFVAGLAFEEGTILHDEARAGILVGSALATMVGLFVLRLQPMPTSTEVAAAASTGAELESAMALESLAAAPAGDAAGPV